MDPNCLNEALRNTSAVTEKITLGRKDGASVPAIVSLPADESGRPVHAARTVLIVHGMGSSKDAVSSEYYRLFFNRAGLGVILYDQPGHGEASGEPIRVPSCLDSLEAADRFAAEQFPDAETVYFGSSFGAYIAGLYIRVRNGRGRSAFFRSGAVVFPEMITGGPGAAIDPQAAALLERRGYMDVSLGGDSPMRFSKDFMVDLMKPEYDLITLYREKIPDVPIAMANGAADPVVPPDAAKAFADEFGIPITLFPGQGHSLCDAPDIPGEVGKLALKWYQRT